MSYKKRFAFKLKKSYAPMTICLTVAVCFIIFWGCGSGENSEIMPVVKQIGRLDSTMLYQSVLDSDKAKVIAPDGGFKIAIVPNAVQAKQYRLSIARTDALALDEALTAKKIALPVGMLPAGNIYTIHLSPQTTAITRNSAQKQAGVYIIKSAAVEFMPITPFDFKQNTYYIAYGRMGLNWQVIRLSEGSVLNADIKQIKDGYSFCLVRRQNTK